MAKIISRGSRGNKSKGFNPDRKFLNSAVKDYVNNGGKITKIVEIPQDINDFLMGHGAFPSPRDGFPLGG